MRKITIIHYYMLNHACICINNKVIPTFFCCHEVAKQLFYKYLSVATILYIYFQVKFHC